MKRPKIDRGDATREKLLNSAIDVFGLEGFHGSTTRMLSEAAGVNQQAIPYYFSGKEGLYVAAAEHIGATISARVHKPRQMLKERLARSDEKGETIGESEARQLLTVILQAFADLIISDESTSWARFIVREQMAPSEAFERIYDAVMGPMIGNVNRLVAVILSDDPSSERVRLRTLSLVGGILVFRMARAAAMRVLDWKEFGPRESDLMREHVASLVGSFNAGPRT